MSESLRYECIEILSNLINKKRFSEDKNLTEKEKIAIELIYYEVKDNQLLV